MKVKKLSIVIPCYNEGSKIQANLKRVEAFMKSLVSESAMKKVVKTFEIIPVNDGSKDGTAEEMMAAKSKWVKPILLDVNQGKGNAIREGFAVADGEFIMFMDADLSVDLRAIRKALTVVAEHPFTAVIGSRKNPQTFIEGKDKWYRKMMSGTLNMLTRKVLPLDGIYDTQCGFKLYPHIYAKYIAEKQQMNRFSFDLEHLLIVRLNGGKIMDIPIHYYKQDTTTVRPVRDTLLFLKDFGVIKKYYLNGLYKKTYERTDVDARV